MSDALAYKRSRFSTRLPTERLYTPAHSWLREHDGVWRIGLTRFALRMLGEIVELDFEVEAGRQIERGEVIGWMEGFKAVTDIHSPMVGGFAGGNPELFTNIERIHADPYRRGWLYAVQGTPGDDCVDAEGYASFLDATIDQMLRTT